MSSYPESPLEDFELTDFDIDAKSAGSIKDDKGWTFTRVNVKTADGSKLK